MLALDLFAGCGGLTQGLKDAGFKVITAVESNATAVATYESNHPETVVIPVDIRTISVDELRYAVGLKPGDLDLLAACPPCQGYSTLRTRNGGKQNRDERNSLVREILRFAREFRPKAIMMENVPRLEGKQALRDLCKGLEALGYLFDIALRDAQFFGVPQRRRRLILLAGMGFKVPFAVPSRDQVTVRKFIGKLTRSGSSGDLLHDLPEKRTEKVRRLISLIPRNGGSRSDLDEEEQLQCHKDCDGFKDIYGRMAWDRVAPTLTGGCFNPSKGRFLHPVENRCITLREAALLQGFPLTYKFDISAGKQAIALMIGNALPPNFIRRHATEIILAIEKQQKAKSLAL